MGRIWVEFGLGFGSGKCLVRLPCLHSYHYWPAQSASRGLAQPSSPSTTSRRRQLRSLSRSRLPFRNQHRGLRSGFDCRRTLLPPPPGSLSPLLLTGTSPLSRTRVGFHGLGLSGDGEGRRRQRQRRGREMEMKAE